MRHGIPVLACSLFILALMPLGASEPLFEATFPGENLPTGWQSHSAKGTMKVENGALRVDVPASEGTKGAASASTALPVERFRGCRVTVRARVKADKVVEPPQHWNGIKCMLKIVTPEQTLWEQKSNVFGSFDWKEIVFTTAIPRSAESIDLILGLESTCGTVWFEKVRMEVTGRQRVRPAKPLGAFKGHDRPRLRGTMISPPRFGEADLEVLAGQWNANHVRWQLTAGGFPRCILDEKPVAEYNAWLDKELAHLESMLPHLEKQGVLAVIDIHTPPGGRDANHDCLLFRRKEYQDAFIANWIMIAKRFRGQKAIWGYDLVNEPVEGTIPEGLMNWRELALATSKAIRQIDPDVPIIIEPAPWGSPEALDWFEPFDPAEVPKVIYSVHFYLPHLYTHQGVHNNPAGIAYPGELQGKYWDKERLRQALRPVIEFQQDYGAAIYLGEFSAARWAPGAERWLSDSIDIFEDYGWDWAYHAFREWDGWSVEHGPDPGNHERSTVPNEREKLLRHWFSKNVRPVSP